MLCYMHVITAGLEYLRSACKVSLWGGGGVAKRVFKVC